MKEISEEEFSKLIEKAKILEKDKFGVKVYLLPNNDICKLFRCKRKFSSAQIYPYAQRFADHCTTLKHLNIDVVSVKDIFRIPQLSRDAVIYPMLPGITLRSALSEAKNVNKLIDQFIDLIVELHQKGVYFRSLHFGNIILTPEGKFALIDVSDMKISSKSLMLIKRVRNFKAVFRYEDDVKFLKSYGIDLFFNNYIKKANISAKLFNTILKMHKIMHQINDGQGK